MCCANIILTQKVPDITVNKFDIYILVGLTLIIAAFKMVQALIPALDHDFAILVVGMAIGVIMNKAGYSFRTNKGLLMTSAFCTAGLILGQYMSVFLYS
ncbi:membrane hypothetical protein [Vibrio chagasii]|nr:membrane hypothetical protein [Vibrio chagasii]